MKGGSNPTEMESLKGTAVEEERKWSTSRWSLLSHCPREEHPWCEVPYRDSCCLPCSPVRSSVPKQSSPVLHVASLSLPHWNFPFSLAGPLLGAHPTSQPYVSPHLSIQTGGMVLRMLYGSFWVSRCSYLPACPPACLVDCPVHTHALTHTSLTTPKDKYEFLKTVLPQHSKRK